MPQLRDDLILEPTKDGKQILISEPKSGAIFEFGEQEAFLIQALRGPYDPAELMAAFNARFGGNDGIREFQEFLEILGGCGLLAAQPSNPRRRVGDRLSQFSKPLLSTTQPLSGHRAENQTSTDNAIGAHPSVEEDEQDYDEVQFQRNNRWHLFQPEGLLDALDRAFSPLRKLVWLIPILLLFSITGIWFNSQIFADSIATAELTFGLAGRLIFCMLTENIVVQLSRGIVARHYGLRVPSFGVVLAYGLLPRFNNKLVHPSWLAKREKIWLICTGQLARLVLIWLGSTLWLLTKSSGTLLPTIGTELALIATVGFLYDINPFWVGYDGYNLLSLLIKEPNFRQRAKSSFRAFFTGRPRVVSKYFKNSFAFVFYQVLSIVFTVGLIAYFSIGPAQRLESNFHGAGVVLFSVIFIYLAYFFLRRARLRKKMGNRQARADTIQGLVVPQQPIIARVQGTQEAVLKPVMTGARRPQSVRSKWAPYLVAVLLVAVLFLPYPYETGGEAEIFPIAQHEIHAEMDGIIEQVHYSGGEWVSQGTVVAEIANHRQKKDVMTTQAAIQAKERDIDRLRSTPSIESIRLAEEQLATARLALTYSIASVDRYEKLFAKGTVSEQTFDDIKKQRDINRQTVEEKRASLEALKAQINPNEIAAAKAELQKLQEDLTFYEEQLRRTRLHMPITGRIATTKLQDLRNKYLEEGQLFCTVEDTREVRVEIAVPEAEIHEVTVGDPVRLKTWAEPGRIFSGTIAEIAPQATEKTYGNVVMVIAILSNPDGALKTGMTGYAKIRGEETLVGIAFTKALIRFFLIEVWSWLP